MKMKVTVTSLELKSPFKFFSLSYKALKIMRQLKSTNCVAIKTKGIWTKHYTMSLWKNEEDLKKFAASGAHLEAMKKSAEISRTIVTYTYDANELPDWKSAKKLLQEKGKKLNFK